MVRIFNFTREIALEQIPQCLLAGFGTERVEADLVKQKQEFAQVVSVYEANQKDLEAETAKHLAWSRENEAKLNAHVKKLDEDLKKAATQIGDYQKKLDEAEATVIERTLWAQKEQKQREDAEAKLSAVEASRWIRMGKAFGLGPKFS